LFAGFIFNKIGIHRNRLNDRCKQRTAWNAIRNLVALTVGNPYFKISYGFQTLDQNSAFCHLPGISKHALLNVHEFWKCSGILVDLVSLLHYTIYMIPEIKKCPGSNRK